MTKKTPAISQIESMEVDTKAGVIYFDTVGWECSDVKVAALQRVVMPKFLRSVTGGSYELVVSEAHPGKLMLVYSNSKSPKETTMKKHGALFRTFFEKHKREATRRTRQLEHELSKRAEQVVKANRDETLGIYRENRSYASREG